MSTNPAVASTALAAALAILTAWSAVGQVLVTGHVTDTAGRAVPGASVSLLGKDRTVLTDSTGAFRINENSPARNRGPFQTVQSGPCIAGGFLCFGVSDGAQRVRVELFDLRGRSHPLVSSCIMPPGEYRMPVGPHMAAGMRIARVTVGGTTTLVRTALAGRTPTRPGRSLAAAIGTAAEPVDTLAVTMVGYISRKVALQSYQVDTTVTLVRRVRVTFTINGGSGTVVTPSCLLTIVDSSLSLAGARFTQVSGVAPLFDAVDSSNGVRSLVLGGAVVSTLPWVLPQGGGAKRVWAEIAWRDSSRARDTLLTSASITPSDILLSLRGPVNTIQVLNDATGWPDSIVRADTSGATTVKWTYCPYPHAPCVEEYVLGRTLIEFSVDTRADSSLDTAFDCWLVTADSNAVTDTTPAVGRDSAWLATPPVPMSLTGRGAGHDDGYIYRYGLDSLAPDAATTLAYLCRYARPRGYPDIAVSDTIRGTPAALIRRLMHLRPRSYAAAGAKEFCLVLRFRGRHFGDSRYAFSRLSTPLARSQYRYRATRFDIYPPVSAVTLLPRSTTALRPTDSVMVSVDDWLPSSWMGYGGVSLALGRVADAQLVVTRTPDTLEWNCAQWIGDSVPMPSVALSDLLAVPHESYDCAPPVQGSPVVLRVPTTYWPPGAYLFGVTATDEFGNAGIVSAADGCDRNPKQIFVVNEN